MQHRRHRRRPVVAARPGDRHQGAAAGRPRGQRARAAGRARRLFGAAEIGDRRPGLVVDAACRTTSRRRRICSSSWRPNTRSRASRKKTDRRPPCTFVPAGGGDYNCVHGRSRIGSRMGESRVNLTHHFLIAMPSMADPHFAHTLTYVCEHNEDGALGIVVNKPIDMTLSALFEQIDVPLGDAELRATRPCITAARSRSTAASCCTGRSATGSRRWRSATNRASRRRRTCSRPSAQGEGPTGCAGVARLCRLVGRPARAGDRAERLAYGRGRRRRAVRPAGRRRGCRRRCGCSASISRGCPTPSGTRELGGDLAAAALRAPAPCSRSISARRIGVAVGETTLGLAHPLATIAARRRRRPLRRDRSAGCANGSRRCSSSGCRCTRTARRTR